MVSHVCAQKKILIGSILTSTTLKVCFSLQRSILLYARECGELAHQVALLLKMVTDLKYLKIYIFSQQ